MYSYTVNGIVFGITVEMGEGYREITGKFRTLFGNGSI